jgi:hypothetical protein
MGICVWSAVHLNIPEQGKSNRQFGLKVGWLIVGLLAPEMVWILWNIPIASATPTN